MEVLRGGARGGLAVDDNLRSVALDGPNFTGCTSHSISPLSCYSHISYTDENFRRTRVLSHRSTHRAHLTNIGNLTPHRSPLELTTPSRRPANGR